MSKENNIDNRSDLEGDNLNSIKIVNNEYEPFYVKGCYFLSQIKEQINKIFEENEISLGVPLESRVKGKDSIIEKINRKGLQFEHVNELKDFLGVRIMLLFKRDLGKAIGCIKDNFNLISIDDKNNNIDAERFGYQSVHCITQISDEWNSIPTLSDGKLFKIEIQIRTLSQHIWAAASHKLQYKIEEQIPKPLRRTIHRISAILEMVDLEFDRVLHERDSYINEIDQSTDSHNIKKSNLDIEILKYVSKKYLPQDYLSSESRYSELLLELKKNGIKTTEELVSIINNHLDEAKDFDKERALKAIEDNLNSGDIVESKWYKGRFFTDVGLIRRCVRISFSKQGKEYKVTKLITK